MKGPQVRQCMTTRRCDECGEHVGQQCAFMGHTVRNVLWVEVDRKDATSALEAPVDALAPPADPLSALNALLVQTVALDRHPWMSDGRYQDVQLGVHDATRALIRALEGWPA